MPCSLRSTLRAPAHRQPTAAAATAANPAAAAWRRQPQRQRGTSAHLQQRQLQNAARLRVSVPRQLAPRRPGCAPARAQQAAAAAPPPQPADTIAGEVLTASALLKDNLLSLPMVQRPYDWSEDNALELLDDLLDCLGPEGGSTDQPIRCGQGRAHVRLHARA